MSSFIPNDLKKSKIFKVLLFIPLSIASILLLPVAVVLLPFYAAWQCVKALTTTKKKYDPMISLFDIGPDNKMGDVTLDFNNWFNPGNME
jgi:hypothetical protein